MLMICNNNCYYADLNDAVVNQILFKYLVFPNNTEIEPAVWCAVAAGA